MQALETGLPLRAASRNDSGGLRGAQLCRGALCQTCSHHIASLSLPAIGDALPSRVSTRCVSTLSALLWDAPCKPGARITA